MPKLDVSSNTTALALPQLLSQPSFCGFKLCHY